jgi:hypothetical protein
MPSTTSTVAVHLEGTQGVVCVYVCVCVGGGQTASQGVRDPTKCIKALMLAICGGGGRRVGSNIDWPNVEFHGAIFMNARLLHSSTARVVSPLKFTMPFARTMTVGDRT